MALSLPGFVGHTEWLEARGGGSRSVMMLAGRRLRVTLVTNHVSLREAIRRLTPARIVSVATITAEGLRRDLGIARPRIAIAGLNPHSGEGGAFGDEEGRIVVPAVAGARRPAWMPTAPSLPTASSSVPRPGSSTPWWRSTTTRGSSR